MPTTTYTPIASVTLSASASEVVFSGLPQTYRDLILVATGTITGATFADVYLRFNGATTGYTNVQMSGNGTTTASGTYNTDVIRFNFYGGWDNSNPGTLIANIMDYSATDKHKTALGRIGDSNQGVDAGAGRWASTNAINQIVVLTNSPQFASGSTFNLFGVIA